MIEEREFGRFLVYSQHSWSPQNLVSSLLSLSAPAEAADCEEEDELALSLGSGEVLSDSAAEVSV